MMHRTPSKISSLVDRAGGVMVGVYEVVGDTTEQIKDATRVQLDRLVLEPGRKIYRGIDRNAFAFFMRDDGEEDVVDVVMSQGADFGEIDPDREPVRLNLEVADSRGCKIANTVSHIFFAIVIASIICLMILKVKRDSSKILANQDYIIASLVFACIFASILVGMIWVFTSRIWNVHVHKLQWSKRRLHVSASSYIALWLQLINLCLMIGSMGSVLNEPCTYRRKSAGILGFLQWTCWNTLFLLMLAMSNCGSLWRKYNTDLFNISKKRKPRALVLDAPLSIHVNKLLIWIGFQVFFALTLWSLWDFFQNSCVSLADFDCVMSTDTKAFISCSLAMIGLYLVSYIYFSTRTRLDIESRPYIEMRFSRIVFGLHHSQILPMLVILTLSIILLTAINIDSCWTYVEVWLGLAPLQAAGTCSVAILGYFYMPIQSDKDQLLSAWLQECSWTLENLPHDLLQRNKKLEGSDDLAKQPMFCIELGIKLLYMSNLVYSCNDLLPKGDIESQKDSNPNKKEEAVASSEGKGSNSCKAEVVEKIGFGNLEDGLALMDFKSWDIIYDEETDTAGLFAFNENNILIAFKGTSSMQNVKTDLDIKKVIHPPHRRLNVHTAWGLRTTKSTPRVHKGFYEAWCKNDYNRKVMEKLQEIYDEKVEQGSDIQKKHIYITGHSLGGALAVLCAYEASVLLPDVPLTVYTYGQPRVGNRAFSYDYNSRVIDHFSIINDQDPVARIPKGNYKRVGSRIIVDSKGDLIVRPTFLEVHLLSLHTGVVKDHFLEFYRKAFIQIIKCQFTDKSLPNGKRGATCLASDVDLSKALMGVNLDLHSLEDPLSIPLTDEDLERKKRSKSKQEGTHLKDKKGSGFGPHMLLCCGGSKADLHSTQEERHTPTSKPSE
eukprot:jgi/Picsp_1/1093/NSC_04576-R1_alpha beta-hydrolase